MLVLLAKKSRLLIAPGERSTKEGGAGREEEEEQRIQVGAGNL